MKRSQTHVQNMLMGAHNIFEQNIIIGLLWQIMPIIFLRLLSGFCPSESCFIIIILFNFIQFSFCSLRSQLSINELVNDLYSHCFHGDYTRFVLSTHKKRSLFFAKTCPVIIHSTCSFTAPKLVKTLRRSTGISYFKNKIYG